MKTTQGDKEPGPRAAKHGGKNAPGPAGRRQATPREKRREQLQLIQELFLSAPIIDLKNDPVPSSSPREEIEQRRAELQYRLDLLKALLEAVQNELELLSKAATATTDGNRKEDVVL